MALKIKWNDDRVRDATNAILLIGRDRILRGQIEDLAQHCLAEFRHEPQAYAAKKDAWAPPREIGPLKQNGHIATFKRLIETIDRLLAKATLAKRRFTSLEDLDHWLISGLRNVR